MKKLLAMLVVALGVGSLFAAQYTDEKGRTWTLSGENTTVSGESVTRWMITGCTPLPEGKFTVPAKLGNMSVWGVADKAFSGATNITSVTVEKGIKYLGYAFCTKDANKVTLPSNIEKVTLPEGLEYIDCDAFENSKIDREQAPNGFVVNGYFIKYTGTNETYTIPAGVKHICGTAFYRANTDSKESVLTNIVISEGVETIQEGAFDRMDRKRFEFGDVVLPDSLKLIGTNAFKKVTFKSLKLGKGITDLENVGVDVSGGVISFKDAFTNAKIESLDFGNGVEAISDGLFKTNATLTSVKFGSALRVIGANAFFSSGLTNVDFSAAVQLEKIGQFAFADSKVVKVDFSACTKLKEIPGCCFYGCDALREVTFNEGLQTIGDYAFAFQGDDSWGTEGLGALESLKFPASLRTIGYYAFNGSTNLAEIVLKDGLETIGDGAFGLPLYLSTDFAANFKLTQVKIPASVTAFGSGVFNSCTNLWEITGGEGVVDFDGYFGSEVPAFASVEFDKDGKTPLPFKVLTFGKTALGFQGPCKSALTAKDFGDIDTIGEEAFAGSNESVSNLVSVAFPATLKRIADGAFSYAENLSTVGFGDTTANLIIGFRAFEGTAIKELTGEFAKIGSGAFANCPALTKVDISMAGVWEDEAGNSWPIGGDVGLQAFASCTNLETAVINACVEDEDGMILTGGWISDYVFDRCSALKSVTVKADTIGSGAFRWSDDKGNSIPGLAPQTVTIDVSKIYGGTFSGMTNLTAVTLGAMVETIGVSAFSNCCNLASVALPTGLVAIAENAFFDCSNLVTVTGGEALTQVGRYAFRGTKFYNEAAAGALKLGSMLVRWVSADSKAGEVVTIPDEIKYIASSAFYCDSFVQKVVVPESVGVIHEYTFESCANLSQIAFKNREIKLVTGIGSNPDPDGTLHFDAIPFYEDCPLLKAAGDKALIVPDKGGFILAGWADNYVDFDMFGIWYNYLTPDYQKLAFHNDASAGGDFVPGSSYTGWITASDKDAIVGTVTVKTGKLDRNKEVKVTMTVQLAGVKKNYTAMFKIDENGKAVITDAAANQFSELAGMYLGGTWLSGKVSLAGQSYRVRGANSSKEALAGMDDFAGHVWGACLKSSDTNLVPVVNGYSGLSISVAKKGKVKVSGTLADGQKISATAQMAAGDNGVFAAPFYVQTNSKKGGFGFVIDFYMDGESPRAWFEREDDGVGTMTSWQYPLELGVDGFSNVKASTYVSVDLSPAYEGELLEIDPKGNGLAEGAYYIGGEFNGAANEALCVACKSPFVFNSQSAELTVNAKGKWTFAKAMKVSVATEKDLEKYQSDIDAALKEWREGYVHSSFSVQTSDGKELKAYDFDYDELIGTYTPKAYLLYDNGSKVKNGELIEGKNTNFCAMKLSYAKKTGLVSGSALYYWVDISKADKPKLKKGKTSISGIVLDGAIYGASTAKNVASGSIESYKVSE